MNMKRVTLGNTALESRLIGQGHEVVEIFINRCINKNNDSEISFIFLTTNQKSILQ